MNPFRIFIGMDSREPTSYHVLAHSIIRRATRPVSITPIALNQLAPWLYRRQRTPKESTEFSFSRFLTPYLSGYQGTSLFLDSDMLALVDIWEIMPLIDWSKAVWVCKHDYTPRTETKMLSLIHISEPTRLLSI